MALKGTLHDVGLNQLLNLIHLARKTGLLTLQAPQGAAPARLHFKEGKLVYASLDNRETRLTDMLVKVGSLTFEQGRSIESRAKIGTDKEMGLLMIQNGFLNQAEIVQGVKSYLLDAVYHLFTWSDGAFYFAPNRLPPEDRITVPIGLDQLILEGTRRAKEMEKLRADLPSLDVPLRFIERPDANLRNINLNVDQWKVISFINSRNTIRQIAGFLKMDEFEIRRLVNALQVAGLIQVAAAPEPARRPPMAAKPTVSRNVLLRVMDRIRGL